MAVEVHIPGFLNLSKTALFQKLKDKYDFERLQRVENRRTRIEENLRSKKRTADEIQSASSSSGLEGDVQTKKKRPAAIRVANKLDPIMFSPICKAKTFKTIRSNGVAIAFNVDTLIEYMVATGDFSDPETRQQFSDIELAEIDAKVIPSCYIEVFY